MPGGTREQALELARQRWSQLHPFDLDEQTWNDLFSRYAPGVLLEAIKLTKETRDPRPQKRYERFLMWIERVQSQQPN
jgi:hypothetical protein